MFPSVCKKDFFSSVLAVGLTFLFSLVKYVCLCSSVREWWENVRSVSAGSVCVCACVSACGYVTGSKAGLRVCVCARARARVCGLCTGSGHSAQCTP